MSATADREFMARALRLAERGLFTTDPNPRVGCVLVRDGEVVGEGFHLRAGEPHAEIHALRQAGAGARGATAYLNLEPCCHHGRTPPCTDALIKAGVARVVAAVEDPNPKVGGMGLSHLREAGIRTDVGLLREQAEALNPGFLKRMRTRRPYVRLKLAMSLDGRTAMASGESQWITGEPARDDVHRLRARASAICTGMATVLADDPRLTVRLPGTDPASVRQPLRVILDPLLSIPEDARLLREPGETLILTAAEAVDEGVPPYLDTDSVRVQEIEAHKGRLALGAVLDTLAELEVNELHVETGSVLSGSFLREGLVDELVLYVAPHIMGDGAKGLFNLPGLTRMDQRVGLEILDIRAVGRDWRVVARPTARA